MKRIATLIMSFLFGLCFLGSCAEDGGATPPTEQRRSVSYVAIINGEQKSVPAGMYTSGAYPTEYVESKGAVVDDLKDLIEGDVFYRFEGWFLDVNCTKAINDITSAQKGNLTLYAKISRADSASISYFAIIDAQKTSIPVGMYKTDGKYPEKYFQSIGAEIDDLQDYQEDKILYSFEGWFLDESLTTAFNGITTQTTGNVTLYASIHKEVEPEIVTKTISYLAVIDGVEGAIPANMYDADASKYPTSYTVGNSAVVGDLLAVGDYVFDGWFLDVGCCVSFDGISNTADTDFVLYAKISTAEKKEIRYYAVVNGVKGNVPAEVYGADKTQYPSFYVVGRGAVIGDLLTTNEYVFGGWYLDEGCKIACNGVSTTESDDVTVYAKLTFASANKKSIIYKAVINGKLGEIPSFIFSAYDYPKVCVIGESVAIRNLPSNVGDYDFYGWYLDAECTVKFTGTFTDAIGESVILYAKMTKSFYTDFYE